MNQNGGSCSASGAAPVLPRPTDREEVVSSEPGSSTFAPSLSPADEYNDPQDGTHPAVGSSSGINSPDRSHVRARWKDGSEKLHGTSRREGHSPAVVTPASTINLTHLLSRSVQSLKENYQQACSKLWESRKSGVLVQMVSILARHGLALVGMCRVYQGKVSWRTGALSIGMWIVSGLGVTAGVHRLWSHQAYTPSRVMEALLMVMFSTADQGTIQGWSLTHAIHHASSDTENDPHSRSEGWWHCHFGWLYSSKTYRITQADWNRVVGGHGPAVKFHDKVFVLWDPFWSLGFPALLASLWGEPTNGFFVAGALRWFCVQHITFFVNSVAHGPRESGGCKFAFDDQASGIGPTVSLLTTFLALGEGWHDYHHLFPWDYAAAELGVLDQWNPTKGFLDLCYHLGLVSRRRRCSPHLQEARRRQLLEERGAPPELVNCAFRVEGWLPFFRYRSMIPEKAEKLI